MADKARGIHVSPGVYAKETVIEYASRSLGITTLGAVGETLRGPAFQPIRIEDWNQFRNIFGGTSPVKFRGSQYPKYELPYVAKSYLEQSRQLDVVRVLGLSGYNAGPAWCITASDGDPGSTKTVIAVLRSNGNFKPFTTLAASDCDCKARQYDKLRYTVGENSVSSGTSCAKETKYNMERVSITAYKAFGSGYDCENGASFVASGETSGFGINTSNFGRFNINVLPGIYDEDVVLEEDKAGEKVNDAFVADSGLTNSVLHYSVSLNPADKDYILNVFGSSPSETNAPLFVESLYDVALVEGVKKGEFTVIDNELSPYNVSFTNEYNTIEPVNSFLTTPHALLSRRMLGVRFLAKVTDTDTVCYRREQGSPVKGTKGSVVAGHVYTVSSYVDEDNKVRYAYYEEYDPKVENSSKAEAQAEGDTEVVKDYEGKMIKDGSVWSQIVFNNADGLYYRMNNKAVEPVTCDLNNYISAFRYASTPWFVSNLKGDFDNMKVCRMFRLHTISDGNTANYEIKTSIENIRPDEGTFDVAIRDINDSDYKPVYLEKFTRCSMIPGTSNYIGYKIGTFDGVYEGKSKYVTVEINDNTESRSSVPCGFLGYPMPQYSGLPVYGDKIGGVTMPRLSYNVTYDADIKNRKQYFGLSDLKGVDVDCFTFKGSMVYSEQPEFLCPGFHLDSRVNGGNTEKQILVDDKLGYNFECVSPSSSTQILNYPPIIGTENEMYGSIYEYVNLRKFTAYFYGGFDGWDIYREQRSNTDDFKMTKYRGQYNDKNGEGYNFNKIADPEALNLNQNGITSDWYAYLAGIRQFSNPANTDINVFVTPGIDYVNNRSLVEEAIEMIEEERADSIYVVTTPDKPSGAGDYRDEMFTPEDAVYNLEDSDIDSNYTCTYYPWVKYLDKDNAQYIYLPPTRDVVKNLASTDNTAYPWFAPAGISRGDLSGVNAKIQTKIEDEDILYAGRINPIKTFAVDGIKVWGQKNLQINDDMLNRIAVRRLLLRMRKLVAIACNQLIFEPNDPTTKKSLVSAISPIMESIKSNRGISDYRIVVQDGTESYDRRELNATIAFKPYQALEWINLDFVVTPEGVSFDNI